MINRKTRTIMNYLIAFIVAFGIVCILLVKGGNRFENYNDEEE